MKTKAQFTETFADIISVENLLAAWREFSRGKRNKKDVQMFYVRLMDHILSLRSDLRNSVYRHGPYQHFGISDPKSRDIHKASVRDRIVHHALYRKLYPFFDRIFIPDSFSCRLYKGTHATLLRFRRFACAASMSYTKTYFALKCDIRKFFASIDHEVLFSVLGEYIPDKNILRLLREVVASFSGARAGVGLPLGNLTSQLLVNVYMNEFDRFAKHQLKAKYYLRFADDFIILHRDKEQLTQFLPRIAEFLNIRLKLSLHPDKVFIKTFASGIDFLGWVHFPDHRVLRTATKRRMFRRLAENPKDETIAAYIGMLSHGNAEKLRRKVLCYHQGDETGIC